MPNIICAHIHQTISGLENTLKILKMLLSPTKGASSTHLNSQHQLPLCYQRDGTGTLGSRAPIALSKILSHRSLSDFLYQLLQKLSLSSQGASA